MTLLGLTTMCAMSHASSPEVLFSGQQELLSALIRAQVGRAEIRSVAVVANAPLHPSRSRAAAIDYTDLVLRMTTFDTDRDDDAAVGRRTDVVVIHRATHAGPGTFENHAERTYLVAEPGRSYMEREPLPAWWPPDLGCVPLSNREFTKPLRKLLRIDNAGPMWATTGTLSVYLMHRLFPEASVLLTGTTLLKRGRRGPNVFSHNWGEAVAITDEHRLLAEGRLLGTWVTEGWLSVID